MAEIFENIFPLEVVEKGEIPDIELYMDQVTTFMENRLSSYKRNAEDKILTKTMINNYAKEKLFPAPYKKRYNKNHMMLLIMIYHLKSVLSIGDIKILLLPVNNELKENPDSRILEKLYDKFIEIQKNAELFFVKGDKSSLPDFKDEDAEIKKILEVLLLTVHAETEKRMAEKLIDE